MRRKTKLGEIKFEFDEKKIQQIAEEGNLNSFLDALIKKVSRDIKVSVVGGLASSSASVYEFSDGMFGTVPFPRGGPFPHGGPYLIEEMDLIRTQVTELGNLCKVLEAKIAVNNVTKGIR